MTAVSHIAGAVLSVAAALLSVAALLGAWRWIIKPTRAAWRDVVTLLRQIRDASQGVDRLSQELRELSGAVIQMTVGVMQAQQHHRELIDDTRDRLGHVTELAIDLAADFRRLERTHKEGTPHDHD